eukprot:CAMPEP_0194524008 /NCGR_PEP_ID=MMETSP0253-20130528/59048_1 /TAXON_ID=2966 /ORGANISM="Noctiluca scintillans" /LENGTH=64 /DNA_ID=CAMNT_0039368595 /DNA_START=285 /DNA_END=475 /DNA_ORIENTATION=-
MVLGTIGGDARPVSSLVSTSFWPVANLVLGATGALSDNCPIGLCQTFALMTAGRVRRNKIGLEP